MLENRERNKKIILLSLYIAAGLLLRILYIYQYSSSPLFATPLGPDVEEYANWANNIIAGQLLWQHVHIHSPLYPYFLALLLTLFRHMSNPVAWVRFSQLLLGFISFIPLLMALKISFSTKNEEPPTEETSSEQQFTLIIFMIIWLVYPPLIYYLGELTSEFLLIPLLSLCIWFLYKSEDLFLPDPDQPEGKNTIPSRGYTPFIFAALAGTTAGLAVTAHPLTLFFIAIELLYLFLRTFGKKYSGSRRKAALISASFAAGAILAASPLVIYNTFVLNENTPLQANSGFNFCLGNGPDADGTCRLRPGPEWDKFHREAEDNAKSAGISKDRYLYGVALKHIADNPAEWLKLIGRKALYVWNKNEITAGADLFPLRYYTAFQRKLRYSFAVCAILALTAVFTALMLKFTKNGNNSFFLRYRHFLLLISAFWIAQTLLVTSGRYRTGMLPAILIIAAAGTAMIIRLARTKSYSKLLVLPSTAAACAIVLLPSPPFHPEKELVEAETILGEALIRQGNLKEAEKLLLSAAMQQNNWSRNYNLLGLIYEKQWKFDKAEYFYNKAVAADPEDPEGYANLATLYSARKMNEEAEKYFRLAFSLGRSTPKLHYNYALFCYENGKKADAEKNYGITLKLAPADYRAMNNLAVILFEKGEYAAAAGLFERAMRLDPGNPDRLMNLALTYLLQGNDKLAETTLEDVKKMASGVPDIQELKKMAETLKKGK